MFSMETSRKQIHAPIKPEKISKSRILSIVAMKNYFRVNEIIMKGAGLYVPPKHSTLATKIFYLIYNSFWIVYSCIIFILSELLAFKHFPSDVAAMIQSLNMVMTVFLGDFKVFLWFWNRKKIMKIIDTLNQYSVIYESFGDFVPEKIIEKEKKLKDMATITYITLGVSVSLSSCIVSFKNLILISLNEDDSANLGNLTLPYFSLIPFSYKESPINFGFAILYQVLAVFNFAWIIVGFDTSYIALVSYISAHLLVIQGAFRTLRERCLAQLGIDVNAEYLNNPPLIQSAMDAEMKKITNHLQTILKTSEEIEELYTFVVLCQTLVSLAVLCTCLYMISLVPGFTMATAKEVIYMSAITWQTFVYCFFGNKVTLSGEDIPYAVFSMNWYATTTSFKRCMIINVSRMHTGIYFTIGKFTPLTLSTFVSIVRGSYSFFAVLKNSS